MNRLRSFAALAFVSVVTGCAAPEASDLFATPNEDFLSPAPIEMPTAVMDPVTPGASESVPPTPADAVKPPVLRCSARAPFARVEAVVGVPNAMLGAVTLSPDEREIFFTRFVAAGSTSEVVRMIRPAASGAFAPATSTIAWPSGFHRGIALSRSGRDLYVPVSVPGVPFAGMELRVAHRATGAADFGPLESAGFSAPYPYAFSQMAFHGDADFLASVTLAGAWRLKRLSLLDATFDTSMGEAQAGVAPNALSGGAVATHDGLYAYVGVGLGDWPTTGIMFAAGLTERKTTASPFPMPSAFGAPMNDKAHGSEPQWLSHDECRLYYISLTANGGRELMVASK